MKYRLLSLLIAAVLFSSCNLSTEKAGVEIMSTPEAKVYIDGIEAGMTPYKNNSLKPKEVEIKLVVDKVEWTKKIRLQNRTSTIVVRDFDPKSNSSGGYVLKIEPTGNNKKAGLLVTARPDRSTIKIDGDTKGQTPSKWDDIGEGEKQIDISFPARKKIVVFAKAIMGYQLVVEADLLEEVLAEPVPEKNDLSTKSDQITIKQTETGWLRVRGQPNTISAEVGKVNPGDQFELVSEQDDYYEIEFEEGKTGWISTKYADKISELDQKTE